jgi:hypothetical protein
MVAVRVVVALAAVVVVMPAVAFAFERAKPLDLMGFKVDRDGETGEIKRGRFVLAGRFGWTVTLALLAAMDAAM